MLPPTTPALTCLSSFQNCLQTVFKHNHSAVECGWLSTPRLLEAVVLGAGEAAGGIRSPETLALALAHPQAEHRVGSRPHCNAPPPPFPGFPSDFVTPFPPPPPSLYPCPLHTGIYEDRQILRQRQREGHCVCAATKLKVQTPSWETPVAWKVKGPICRSPQGAAECAVCLGT